MIVTDIIIIDKPWSLNLWINISKNLLAIFRDIFDSSPIIKLSYTGKCDCEISKRFADISIVHLRTSLLRDSHGWMLYGKIIAELFDNSRDFAEAAESCHGADRYYLYHRVALERSALAAMMMARAEQIGLKLVLRRSPIDVLYHVLRALPDCLTGANDLQAARLERAEARLAREFRRSIGNANLSSALREMLASLRDMAAPGAALAGLKPSPAHSA